MTGIPPPFAGAGTESARRPGWREALDTRPRFLALAAFLFAGDLKADPTLSRIPGDLTLLAGLGLSVLLLVRFLRGARIQAGGGAALVAVWYLSFVPGLFQLAPGPYALQKAATIFTFSLLASIAPFLLLEERRDPLRAMNALACFCLAIALGAWLGGAHGERLAGFGGGTISLGRAAGLLFVYAALALPESPLPAATFGVMLLAGLMAIFSGSRGPLLAALAALALLYGLGRVPVGRRWARLLAAAGLFLALLGPALTLAPRGSLDRVTAFFHGRYGASEAYRTYALRAAWELVPEHPWGIGWGGFATRVDPERGVPRQYPHNFLVEVTLESGWACGAATVATLLAALGAAWAGARQPGGRVVFAGVVFYLVNGLVSGDLNDNRPLFMFLSAALALGRLP